MKATSANRTNVELKSESMRFSGSVSHCANRTNVELKFGNLRCGDLLHRVLIVLM